MTVKQVLGLVTYLVVAAPAGGGAAAQLWLPAACDIKPGHYLVNSGVLYLKSAFTTKFADQRAKDLKDASRVLTQALTSGGQEKNPAAWYYLGRYYLMADDLVGADSAFTKALAFAPKCKDDVGLYRRQAWVPVFNAGVQAWQGGNTDSAIASFRRANQIYQGEPMGFVYLANLFVSANQMDSAAKYFRLAVPAASDPKYAKDRRDAFFNVARVYHSAQRYDEAEAVLKPLLRTVPGIAEINESGGYEKQYVIQPKPDALTDVGMTFSELANLVAQNVENAGGGIISRGGQQLTIRAVSRVASVEDIANLPLKFGAGVKPLLVKDVAEVKTGTKFRTGAATLNGHETVIGTTMMLAGQNSREVAERVKGRIAEIQTKLPGGDSAGPAATSSSNFN